jgi:hypothetical protein
VTFRQARGVTGSPRWGITGGVTQDDFLGGLNFDGSKRDVEVGPTTGIVRYYPVPPAPPARTPWWRYTLVFVLGLTIGIAAGVVLCSNFL